MVTLTLTRKESSSPPLVPAPRSAPGAELENAGTALPARGNLTRKFMIGRDALDLTGLDLEQAADVEWLWTYCRDRDLGRAQLDGLLKKGNGKSAYSYDSIYQLFTGRRGGSETGSGTNDALCRSIAEFRRMVDAQPVRDGFKETQLARTLWRYGKRAMDQQSIGFVFGNFAVGKTTAFEEMARRNPKVVYSRMPTRGHLNHYLKTLARKLAMGDRQTVLDLSDRVIDAFEPGMLLIVDEADQVFSSIRNVLGLATLDFLRELWDRARCGIILVMDHAGRDQVLHGPNKKRLQRLWRRRLPMLQLPDVPYREDLALFAGDYGLPPAPDEPIKVRVTFTDADGEEQTRDHTDNPAQLQRRVLRDPQGGLFVWLGILAEAREMAVEAKRTLTWGAVIKAHAAFAAGEMPLEEEE